MIAINRVKAEAAVIERLRVERAARFSELDVEFMRAIELGADTGAISGHKQALRDVTVKDLSVLSLDELASLTLDQALAI